MKVVDTIVTSVECRYLDKHATGKGIERLKKSAKRTERVLEKPGMKTTEKRVTTWVRELLEISVGVEARMKDV